MWHCLMYTYLCTRHDIWEVKGWKVWGRDQWKQWESWINLELIWLARAQVRKQDWYVLNVCGVLDILMHSTYYILLNKKVILTLYSYTILKSCSQVLPNVLSAFKLCWNSLEFLNLSFWTYPKTFNDHHHQLTLFKYSEIMCHSEHSVKLVE